jgi:ferritin-like metal-binding protein YciE
MAIQNPKELFVMMLSNVRQREERTTEIFRMINEVAKDPDVKEALESRIFIKDQILSSLDRCFELIREKPMKPNDRLHDVFVEDFKRELAEIQAPAARHLFILAKAKAAIHLRIAEYAALTAMADLSGHFGVGVLLETCLAEQLAFVERTRRLVRHLVAKELGERLAA